MAALDAICPERARSTTGAAARSRDSATVMTTTPPTTQAATIRFRFRVFRGLRGFDHALARFHSGDLGLHGSV